MKSTTQYFTLHDHSDCRWRETEVNIVGGGLSKWIEFIFIDETGHRTSTTVFYTHSPDFAGDLVKNLNKAFNGVK